MDIGAYRDKRTITSDFLDVVFTLMHFWRIYVLNTKILFKYF